MPLPCHTGLIEPLHPWVDRLVSSLTEQGRLDSLDAAIKASVHLPELTAWKIYNGDNFLQYASCLLIYWVPREDTTAKLIYDVVTVFYYIFEHTEMSDLHFEIELSSLGPDSPPVITPISKWIFGYAMRMREWLVQPGSTTPESHESFWNHKLQDLYRVNSDSFDPQGGFKDFNQIFCKSSKEDYSYPNVRPIASIDDPHIVTFQADSIFNGRCRVDDNDMVTIKTLPWPITDLLVGSQYADRLKDGTPCHAFLSSFDSQHQHAPVAGTIVESHVTNQRGRVIIDTGTRIGHVAVVTIGGQTSSINLSRKTGDAVKKGEEISWVEFGGSDIVLIFEKAANSHFLAKYGVHHLFRQGLCGPNPSAT